MCNFKKIVKGLDQSLAEAIEVLWKDPGIQRTWDHRANFQIFDSASFFFNHVSISLLPPPFSLSPSLSNSVCLCFFLFVSNMTYAKCINIRKKLISVGCLVLCLSLPLLS